MPIDFEDTIAAIASAPGGALRGIVRISGPRALEVVAACVQADESSCWESVREATALAGEVRAGSVVGAAPCEVLVWPNARSYTRQPSAEIHTIGSPPLLEAVLRELCGAGARLAEPGEFTMRAFLAGRLDLTQAEAVLGVIDAGGQQELQAALSQLAGGLAAPLNELRSNLLDLLAHLEAGLDFVEEDIEFISGNELTRQIGAAAEIVCQIVEQMESRAQAGGEVRVVLRGWPNVGKSSLLNALAGAPAALVSEIPGATRDYLTHRVSIDGIPCELVDTAGVELDCVAEVSAAAQQQAADQSRRGHVQLLCLDATRPLNDWEREQLDDVDVQQRILVITKCDRPRVVDAASLRSGAAVVFTSSKTGAGLDELRGAIGRCIAQSHLHESRFVASTAARCRDSLQRAADSLQRAAALAQNQLGDELVAAEVRAALDDLGAVVGAVYTDDILDRVFSRFCIGK